MPMRAPLGYFQRQLDFCDTHPSDTTRTDTRLENTKESRLRDTIVRAGVYAIATGTVRIAFNANDFESHSVKRTWVGTKVGRQLTCVPDA
jgi:hypothetical protein